CRRRPPRAPIMFSLRRTAASPLHSSPWNSAFRQDTLMRGNYRVCRKLVREHDRDRYLAALLAPSAARKHLFALYAFNYEIARIRELVREPMPGELRLQWWRDAVVGQAHGDVARHPAASAVVATIEKFSLPRAQFLE